MKNKLFLAALAAIVMVSGYSTDAHAVKLTREPLSWYHSGTVFPRLTVASTFGDTTQSFGIDTWVVPPNASADTVNIGAVIVSMDTSVTTTANLTDFVFKILVYSNDGVNPTAILAPGTQTLTSGTKYLSIPLFISTGTALRAAHKSSFPMSGNKIRVLVLGGTGSIPAAKVELVHYTD